LDESLGKFCRLLESVVIVRFDYFFGGLGSILGLEGKGEEGELDQDGEEERRAKHSGKRITDGGMVGEANVREVGKNFSLAGEGE
jgi:hypothetical protein